MSLMVSGVCNVLFISWTSAHRRDQSTESHCIDSFSAMYMIGCSLVLKVEMRLKIEIGMKNLTLRDLNMDGKISQNKTIKSILW